MSEVLSAKEMLGPKGKALAAAAGFPPEVVEAWPDVTFSTPVGSFNVRDELEMSARVPGVVDEPRGYGLFQPVPLRVPSLPTDPVSQARAATALFRRRARFPMLRGQCGTCQQAPGARCDLCGHGLE